MWNGESFWSLIFKECRCSKTSRVLYCIVDVVITLRGLIDYKPQPKNMTPTLCIYWVDVVLGSNKSSSRLSDLHSDLHKFGSKKRSKPRWNDLQNQLITLLWSWSRVKLPCFFWWISMCSLFVLHSRRVLQLNLFDARKCSMLLKNVLKHQNQNRSPFFKILGLVNLQNWDIS